MLHEQNAFLGRANHVLAKFANALALSWPQTKNLPAMQHVEVTGIPVRKAFFDAAQTPYRLAATAPVNLAVLGGSQGASILASLVPDAIAMLSKTLIGALLIPKSTIPLPLKITRQRPNQLSKNLEASIKHTAVKWMLFKKIYEPL